MTDPQAPDLIDRVRQHLLDTAQTYETADNIDELLERLLPALSVPPPLTAPALAAPAVPPGMVLVSSEPWPSQRIAGAAAWAAAWADPDLSPTDKAAAVYRAMLAAAPTAQQEPKP